MSKDENFGTNTPKNVGLGTPRDIYLAIFVVDLKKNIANVALRKRALNYSSTTPLTSF